MTRKIYINATGRQLPALCRTQTRERKQKHRIVVVIAIVVGVSARHKLLRRFLQIPISSSAVALPPRQSYHLKVAGTLWTILLLHLSLALVL